MPATETDTSKDEDLDEEDLEDEDDGDQGGKGTENEKFDEARARKTIENQRAAEKKLKKELSELKATLKTIQDKDLPDAEKTKRELAEAQEKAHTAERKVRKATLKSEAMEQAAKLRFRSPALAARLIDFDDVDWDDDDNPINIKDLLKDVLEEDPSLKGRARRTKDDDDDEEDEDDGAGAGRSGKSVKGGNFMNTMIRKSAGR